MEQQKIGLSRDDLFKFLDFTSKKGLVKKQTTENRRRACEIILGILDSTEAADLSRINLENVILRHKNLAASTIPPSTLSGHESHVRGAVRDFLEYAKDPSSWKPGVRQRPSKAAKAASSGTKSKSGKKVEGTERQEETPWQPSVHIDLQIHISPDAKPEQIDQIFASIGRHLPRK